MIKRSISFDFSQAAATGDEPKTYTVATVHAPNNYTNITQVRRIVIENGQQTEYTLSAEEGGESIHIRWVPTPIPVVRKMAEMAKIGPGDVVYDLGCGDAVTLVTAISEFRADRGVGVDADSARLTEAKKYAARHWVLEKIDFVEADITRYTDLSEATVVMLYLADEMNLRLRPNLWRHLKPGTRVVSHRFLMADWKPDQTCVIHAPDGEAFEIHLWTITGAEGATGDHRGGADADPSTSIESDPCR